MDGEWGDGSAGHVVGVFEADERGLGAVVDFGADGGLDVVPGENAAVCGDGAGLTAEKAAVMAISQSRMWERDSQMTSWPCCVWRRTAI
jgi:hypothetical protein